MEKQFVTQRRYSEAFKRAVIEEYLSTGCTKMALLRKYEIPFKSAIQHWMKKLGYDDVPQAVNRRCKFVTTTPEIMPPTTTSCQADADVLKAKIAELERALHNERLLSEAYLRMLEKAEKELQLPIRKKFSTK